ncbi:carboxypeptidase-like regulatory domain-containing protein [Haloparvum sp. PAK95]|uniref:carboxypeptidase-like regulatory domain-containing protein n=1 Tax=Haloparvum sp. PAK95 TaxID=3418962 RepID=UPI003D2F38E6
MSETAPSRTAATLVVLAAALLAMTALAGVVAADAVQENESDLDVQAEHDAGTLEIQVQESAFPEGNDTDDSIAVAVDGQPIADSVDPETTEDGWNVYRVDLVDNDRVPGGSLDSVNVTVTTQQNRSGTVTNRNLQYIALDDAGISFDGTDRLVFDVRSAVGVTDGTKIRLDATAGDESAVLNGTFRRSDGGKVVVDHDAAFRRLALQNGTVTVTGSPDRLTIRGATVDLATPIEDTEVTETNVVLHHPLLFTGESYVVTITTEHDGGTTLTTKRVTAESGSVSFEHGGTVDSTTRIEVERGDLVLKARELTFGSTLTGSYENGKLVLEDATDRLEGDGVINATVALADGETHHFSDVRYENGTVRFGDLNQQFGDDVDRVVLDPADKQAFAVEVTVENGSSSAPGSMVGEAVSWVKKTLTDPVQSPFVPLLLVGGAALLLVLGVIVIRSGSGTGKSAASATPKMSPEVRIVDAITGELVDGTRAVSFDPQRAKGDRYDPEHQSAHIDGRDSVTLKKGHYVARLPGGEEEHVRPGDSTVELRVQPQSGTLTVTSDATDGPVAGATATLTLPDGSSQQKGTDENGQVDFEVPGTVDAADCELEVDHERYDVETGPLTDTVRLEPLTGDLSIQAAIDGEPVPGIDVVLEPADEHVRRTAGTRTASTDGGIASFGSLPVGDYEARVDFDEDGPVTGTLAAISVRRGDDVTETIDASFTFELSPTQRERIDELHRDISELTPSNRDGAIPYYYASVLSEVLSAIGRFEDSGVVFLRYNVDPNTVVDAVLDAVDHAIGYTRRAMTNKQNVDLFTACQGLRETRTKWTGDVRVDELVAFTADEKANHRREMIDRLEEINDLLGEKRDQVSTVTPARAQYEQVREHATGRRDTSPIEQRAHFFVGLKQLDAVEELFEHPELVDRLEETVF